MRIQVFVKPYVRKYIAYKHPKTLTFHRKNIYAMLFFAEWKYRERVCYTNDAIHKLSDVIYIELSQQQWTDQRLKKEPKPVVYIAFNKIIRDFFFQDFFQFMDISYYAKLKTDSKTEIREIAQAWIDMLQLSDDEMSIETLLRTYRRYRDKTEEEILDIIDQLDI